MANYKNHPNWFLDNATKIHADILLQGTPNGTFLIRPQINGHFALSLVCNYKIYHCAIYRNKDNCFGFGTAAPFRLFNTVGDLVSYYSKNSLSEITEILTIELLHPINSELIKFMRHYTPPDI